MHFTATADTDVGTVKTRNQDSILIRHAASPLGEILMALVCDGMGGLEKGELASATVVREFRRWFDEELPFELEHTDMQVIGRKWALLLKKLNGQIGAYGARTHTMLGTTFTGVLFVDTRYVVVHVGDTRLYQIGNDLKQLTTDQTYIARELSRGRMTEKQARTDKRRNMLLQCVGASATLEPEIHWGHTEPGIYLLCSDGFRHEISEFEMYEQLNPGKLTDQASMHRAAAGLMELAKQRKERDNISVVLVRVEQEQKEWQR